MEPTTIAAIATPPGSGGIGIIRISGKESLKILQTLFSRADHPHSPGKNFSVCEFQSHRLYLGSIVDPVSREAVDQVLITIMKAPRSYTVEDVVEIQSHSGSIVLNKIMKLVLGAGAEIAQPGEFTRRAFLNGRIDLTQAEAVTDVISAKTLKSLEIATENLRGKLGEKIHEIRDALRGLLAAFEVQVDFPDDAQEDIDVGVAAATLNRGVIAPMEALLKDYENNHYYRDGIRMVVVGRPNVGKSSLLNRLLKKERAIVTEIPGTTRDTIEEMININGLPVIIVDTAGLHQTDLKIEKLGIERTHQSIDGADLVLFMIDANLAVKREDIEIYERIKHKPHIIVVNKIDLEENTDIPIEWDPNQTIRVSVLKNRHIEALERLICDTMTFRETVEGRSLIVPNARQAHSLRRAVKVVARAHEDLMGRKPTDLIALDLKEGVRHVDEILGLRYGEDVLDIIFEQFCIGK